MPVRLTHEPLAELTSTSRETATKILGEYAARGLVDLARRRITVLDADGLRGEAG